VTWRDFKRYFQKKYLTKCYYDRKMKEFFKLKLGSMIIDEYERIFLELLKYVPFIKDEKVKIKRYLSWFPSFISDKIQYDKPRMLEETIRCTKCLYENQRGISTLQKVWEDKMKSKVEQTKKGDKPLFLRNTAQGQKTLPELKMMETVGQKSWKKHM
jgi:hypothetical protein